MTETFLALAGLVLSAFFSGSEIAFVRANPLQMKVWEKQGWRTAPRTFKYLQEPERFLTTVLVGTNFANVLTSSYATISLLHFGIPRSWAVFIIAFIILVFGEIIPKMVFGEQANKLAVRITPLLHLTEFFLSPLVRLVKSYSRLLSPTGSDPAVSLFNREDLKILFTELGTREEYEEGEKEVISRIFEFGLRPVQLAMTARPDVVAITTDYSVDGAIQAMSDTGLSKLPVYERDLDHIVGIVFLHDLFARPESLASILKTPVYISESMPANGALQELKRQKSSIAIVVELGGRTAGLVTVEDLVEELFGEFEDVFDAEGRKITRVPDGSLIVDSLVEVDELRRRFGFGIPLGDYETVGGFILSRMGRIPRTGEMLDFDTFRIKILSSSPSRLKRLHLIKRA
ncbi:MAG: hemolysin family protein [Candidatus Neomarinimicrobiota bacterium]